MDSVNDLTEDGHNPVATTGHSRHRSGSSGFQRFTDSAQPTRYHAAA